MAKILVPMTLDSNGNGYMGPDEGVHIPVGKFLAVSSHAPHSPANGRDGDYLLAPVGWHEWNGEIVVQVVSHNPGLAGATVYPAVLTAD